MRTTIELKKGIIAKFENGDRVSDLATEYTAKSAISNKEVMKAANVANGVTIVHSKQRPQIMDQVEKPLLIRIKENELAGDSISEGIICEKALQISQIKSPVLVLNVNVGPPSKPQETS